MKRVQLETTTGSETIEWGEAKVCLFVHSAGEEEFLSKSTKARRISPSNVIDAVPGLSHELAGRWFTASYEADEGTLLKLYAKVKTSRYGVVSENGACILRLRADAPVRRISIALSGHRHTALKTATITGRFDIVPSLSVATSRYGFKLPDRERPGLYAKSSADRLFSVEDIAEGIEISEKIRESKVKVTGSDNTEKTVTVVRVKKLRKLGL